MTGKYLREKYHQLRRQNQPIDDDMNAELARRFTTYNPQTRSFSDAPIGPRRKDLHQITDVRIRQIYNDLRRRDMPIPADLNSELARRFPKYNAQTRSFYTVHDRPTLAVLRQQYYNLRAAGNPIPDDLNETLAEKCKSYDPVKRVFLRNDYQNLTTQKVRNAPHIKTLKVEVKTTKSEINNTYSDIYINGSRVFKAHQNACVETFLDGTILGVYGTPSDDIDLANMPTWRIYDTDLHERTFNQAGGPRRNLIHILRVTNTQDGKICLHTSNRMMATIKKPTTDKLFEIVSQKTK